MACRIATPTSASKEQYDIEIEVLAAIGISAMMHGYMAFNKKEEILVPFRTWRNTNTGKAAGILSELFHYNIPLRWSISHLYQAILNNEEHVHDIDFLTTLAASATLRACCPSTLPPRTIRPRWLPSSTT